MKVVTNMARHFTNTDNPIDFPKLENKMNERIQELLEQATDTIEIVNPDTGITHYREFFDKEKFAELIVWECAKRVDYWESRQGEHADDLLKHFGVEE